MKEKIPSALMIVAGRESYPVLFAQAARDAGEQRLGLKAAKTA